MKNLNQKKILVTGGAGFIGSNLVMALQKKYPKADISVVDNFSSGDVNNLKEFKGRIVKKDIADINLKKYFPKLNIIFHQAAIADSQITDRERMFRCILGGFKNVLNYSLFYKCKLIYASSSGVYGNSKPPMKEDRGEEPNNVYSEAKLKADNLARKHFKNSKNAIVGLRYFNVYGPNEEYKNKTANIIWQFYREMIKGKRPKIFGSGEQKKDFIYVKDVINANFLALKTKKSFIVNVGTGKAISFNEIIAILNSFLKKDIKPVYVENPYLGHYQIHTEADLTQAKLLLNFQPKYNIKEGIRDYLFKL